MYSADILTKVKNSGCLSNEEFEFLSHIIEAMESISPDCEQLQKNIDKLWDLYNKKEKECNIALARLKAYQGGLRQACYNLEVLTGISGAKFEEGIMNFDLEFYL